jgi:hypothetical protein
VTYDEVAKQLEVELCPGGDGCWWETVAITTPARATHRTGFVDGKGVVHWRPRGVSRPGLRNFLKLVAAAKHPELREMSMAARLWRMNVIANELAAKLHVRIARHYSDLDRAYVREQIDTITDTDTRRQAERWSQNT